MTAKTLKIDVHTPAGKTDGAVELPAELFDVEPNIALMHQVVEAQRAAGRQGTHSTKTRPVPFWRYGFLPPPRTSPRVFVECVPCRPAAR